MFTPEKESRKRGRMNELDNLLAKRQKAFLESLKEVRRDDQERRDKRQAEMLVVFRELIDAYKSK
ncbi:hypothetical protein PINS_up022177 [Pythium insidiosum]|nr:hypothetical protein PINS_up022177 [Pythium insidiosum]